MATIQDRQAQLDALNAPLEVLKLGQTTKHNDLYRCRLCGSEIERPFHYVRSLKRFSCNTPGCTNSQSTERSSAQSSYRVANQPSLEAKQAQLDQIGAPFRLLRAASSSKSKHLFQCVHCQGEVERAFQKVVLDRQFCCNTLGCQNSLSVVAVKPVTTFDKAQEAFARFGATIISEYKGSKYKVQARCKCSAIFEVRPDDVLSGKQKARCRKCSVDELLRGEEHPAWNPNKAGLWVMRRQFKRPDGFYSRVKLFHGGHCFVTKQQQRPDKLTAHHLDAAAAYLDRAHDVHNGVCLSREMHRKFHNQFHYGKNTAEQFAEFFEQETGEPFSLYYDLKARRWNLEALAQRYAD